MLAGGAERQRDRFRHAEHGGADAVDLRVRRIELVAAHLERELADARTRHARTAAPRKRVCAERRTLRRVADLEELLDRLYAAPPAEFVAARDAAAKELEGEERKQVKALRRPTAGAALANRLVREEPELLDDLLAAGERLRAAQVDGADDLRDAVAGERAAVNALVKAAAGLEGATSAATDRVRAILHAAAGDEDLRTALSRGWLDREAAAGGAWPAITVAPRPSPPRARRSPSRGDGDASSKIASRREEEAERKRLYEEAIKRRRERSHAVDAAERAAAQAHKRLERTQAATEQARERLQDAEAAEAEAREDAQRTLRALNEAEALRQQADDDVSALET